MSGVVVRPWRVPEWTWALIGAGVLVLSGLLPWRDAAVAVGKGLDVYLFLAGMMLLSELARREGLFEFLAAHAVHLAKGSPRRLFLLAYAIGTVVTMFMSNDATAVVLTPAVYAAARQARAPPLPYLFACAFIANAASFVLPISNPANLVIFGRQLPPLAQWLALFALPSVVAIVATYATHRVLQRGALRGTIASEIPIPALSRAGATTGYGIVVVAIALLVASFQGIPLGWPTLAGDRAGGDDHPRGQARSALCDASARVLGRPAAGRRIVRAGAKDCSTPVSSSAWSTCCTPLRIARSRRRRGARASASPSPPT